MIKTGDVVLVRFPFAEGKGHKWRPAVVISSAAFYKKYELSWVMMITSAENEAWPGDVPIADPVAAGLNTPSVIRPVKITAVHVGPKHRIGTTPKTLHKKLVAFARAAIHI